MARIIRTYSDEWLRRHRVTHERHPVFGTHRHPYLHGIMRDLAREVTNLTGEPPTLLDYGCGKGYFMTEMSRLGLFGYVRGFDPAVHQFKLRPSQIYDVVVCLDVLDQVEGSFVTSLIEDVEQFTGRIALFDVITVQTAGLAHLNPRSGQDWQEVISHYMDVRGVEIRKAPPEELSAGACPERAIICAQPRN